MKSQRKGWLNRGWKTVSLSDIIFYLTFFFIGTIIGALLFTVQPDFFLKVFWKWL